MKAFNVLFLCGLLTFAVRAQEVDTRQWVLVTKPDSSPSVDVSQSDVEVLQDGRPTKHDQPTIQRDAPFRVGLLLDESGSGRRFPGHELLLERVVDWAGEILQRQKGDAFMVGFNDQIITSTEITGDTSQFRLALGQLRPIGGSAVRDAVVHGSQKFDSVRPPTQPAARLLVLVSDGADNASYAKEKNAIESAQRSGVRIYTIGFSSPELSDGRAFLEHLAASTGGQSFFLASVKDVDQALATIERDVSNSFLVGFVSNANDGKAHKLGISWDKAERQLRYTPAFYSPAAQ